MESIPLPTTVRWEEGSSPFEKKLIIEPLFPGYGTTVGNALRRVLLNSLPGAAVVAVRIEGVDHEFSTMEHVKEDVVEILLNIKQLRFRLEGQGPVTLRLDAHGQKEVTAGDIEENGEVTVPQKDQPIATLTSKDARLRLELVIEKGRGYLPTESRDAKQKLPIGMIAVDAIFTPMRNVGISLEHVRVGQMTNFDKLTVLIETDGTVSPQEAVSQSLAIALEQFGHIHQLMNGGATTAQDQSSPEDGATTVVDADEDLVEESKK